MAGGIAGAADAALAESGASAEGMMFSGRPEPAYRMILFLQPCREARPSRAPILV